jgi:hypothetical protein
VPAVLAWHAARSRLLEGNSLIRWAGRKPDTTVLISYKQYHGAEQKTWHQEDSTFCNEYQLELKLTADYSIRLRSAPCR